MYQFSWKSFSFIIGPLLGRGKKLGNVIFLPLCFPFALSCREKLSTSRCARQPCLPHVKMSALAWHAEVTYQQVRGQRQIAWPTRRSLVGDQGAAPRRLALRESSLWQPLLLCRGWLASARTPRCKHRVTHAQLEIRFGNRKQWRDLGLPVVFSDANSSATPSNVRNYSSPLTGVYTH